MQSGSYLVVNINMNCSKFAGASFSLFQIVVLLMNWYSFMFTKCLPILLNGLDCFKLHNWQIQKLSISYNTIIRRIFNLSRMTSIRN